MEGGGLRGAVSGPRSHATVSGLQSVSKDTFGPLIAYLLPGATLLLGLSQSSPALRSWFAFGSTDAPTIGGFLYLTVASLGAGMAVSATRWLLIDSLHRWTGIPPPKLDFAKLGKNVDAFAILIEIHYHFYQHHANMLVAIAAAYLCFRLGPGINAATFWTDAGVTFVEIVFFVTSRDNLRKYYERSRQLLSATPLRKT